MADGIAVDFDREIAARTLWMEARGDGKPGEDAVAHVLLNRLATRRWGATLASVCLAAYQFSCWNTSDPNRKAMAALAPDDPVLQTCRDQLAAALGGEADPTLGATHYVADYVQPPPAWVIGATLTARIGHHIFYTNVK